MAKKSKILSCAVVFALTGFVGGVSAADVYQLDTVTVTANRYEKNEFDVPASIQVISQEKLVQTGQNNLQQAMGFMDGIVYSSMGPNGTAVSSMTSKAIIRGVTDGTVVLMNGTPINWRGKYNLEDIPLESIEKVEVVRGGGAVLYGSQATGGVINIITKKKMNNSVSVGLGNDGQRSAGVTVGAGDFSIAYNYAKWGDLGFISSSWPNSWFNRSKAEMRQHFINSKKHDVLMTYKMNDNFDLLYNHNVSKNNWEYVFAQFPEDATGIDAKTGDVRYDREYEREKDFIQLNYRDESDVSGHIYYNRNTLRTVGTDYFSDDGKLRKETKGKNGKKGRVSLWPKKKGPEKEKNLSYGYDVQKVWGEGTAQTFLLGTTYERNEFVKDVYASKKGERARNIFSVLGSWEKAFGNQNKLTVSGRETWTTGADENKNYNNFSGQIQYLHSLNENENIYASIGQSFVLPSFSQMYSVGDSSRIQGNKDLSPEKGIHYELGWKKDKDNIRYKVALFAMKITDNITYSLDKTDNFYHPINEDFKNHGLEASVTVKKDNGFTWHGGITLQDPKSKSTGKKLNIKDYWDRAYGRFMLNFGVNYEKDKWTASLNANYLADRVLTPSSDHSFAEKPSLLTSVNIKYMPNEVSDINLSMNNILDRDDNICHGITHYGSTPFNYLLTYRYKF